MFFIIVFLVLQTNAYLKGGQDFNVFFHAFELVLQGRLGEVYSNSPDRFLYAPAFAILFSPLAFLPKSLAFFAFNLLKAISLKVAFDRVRSSRLLPKQVLSMPLFAIAFVACIKPFWIDFQYGNVNSFILSAILLLSVMLLSNWPKFSGRTVLFVLFICFTKPAILSAILMIVFGFYSDRFRLMRLVRRGAATSATNKAENRATIQTVIQTPKRNKTITDLGYQVPALAIGSLFFFVILPLMFLDVQPTLQLYKDWFQAMVDRSLPLEAHNQSIIALFYRLFSDQPWVSLSLPFGSQQFIHGVSWLNGHYVGLVVLLITLLLCVVSSVVSKKSAFASALFAFPGLLHLAWKPYFITTFPLLLLVLAEVISAKADSGSIQKKNLGMPLMGWVAILLVVLSHQLSGIDIVSPQVNLFLEGFSIYSIVQLALFAFFLYLKERTQAGKKI